MTTAGWRRLSRLLFAAWLGCAALGLRHIHAGLITSYGADLTQPAWLFIIARGLDDPTRGGWLRRLVGSSSTLAAVGIFTGAALLELSQRWWPHGLFAGTFDPLDFVMFAAGIGGCYWLERRALARSIR
jgi:hypothetical protein